MTCSLFGQSVQEFGGLGVELGIGSFFALMEKNESFLYVVFAQGSSFLKEEFEVDVGPFESKLHDDALLLVIEIRLILQKLEKTLGSEDVQVLQLGLRVEDVRQRFLTVFEGSLLGDVETNFEHLDLAFSNNCSVRIVVTLVEDIAIGSGDGCSSDSSHSANDKKSCYFHFDHEGASVGIVAHGRRD